MVKIENVEEFNSIKKSDYGFVVHVKNDDCIVHKTRCNSINADNFIDSTDPKFQTSYHWFSSVALVEKSFPKTTSCTQCNPD